MTLKLIIRGARGTLPCTSDQCKVFGGATACFYVPLPDRHVIFDAGSGIVDLGQEIIRDVKHRPIELVLSHFHLDHIMGLIFFAPMFEADWPVRIWTSASFGAGAVEAALDHLLTPPLCPVTRDMMRAGMTIEMLEDHKPTEIADGAMLSSIPLWHPGGNAGYRLDYAGRSLVYSGDFEHGNAEMDAAFVDFMSGADMALLDSTYTPGSYESARGYGHAHWQAAGDIAQAAGVGRWLATHHGHLQTDDELLAIESDIQKRFPTASLARQGDIFEI